jgi:2-dehydropantoate 2-reductase
MRILILGAGGIGGYFGGRLAEAGMDVTFLVRPARSARLASSGLRIISPLGDALITPKIASRVEHPFDLVILSCKAYDLEAAIAAIGPGVGSQTLILPLLNGLAHLDRLDAAFGPDHTAGGAAHISVTLSPDGVIHHLNKLQSITYGARTPAQTARCDMLAELFARAPFPTRNAEDIMREMWEKFAFITAAAGITGLMRANVGAIMATRDGARLTRQMVKECANVAEAAGYPIRAKAMDWALSFLTQGGSDFTASMLRDLENGGKIEADHLQGDMIRRGASLDVATKLLSVALCHFQAYENRRGAA